MIEKIRNEEIRARAGVGNMREVRLRSCGERERERTEEDVVMRTCKMEVKIR